MRKLLRLNSASQKGQTAKETAKKKQEKEVPTKPTNVKIEVYDREPNISAIYKSISAKASASYLGILSCLAPETVALIVDQLELCDLFSLGATCSKFYLQFMDNFQYFKNLHEKATTAEIAARETPKTSNEDSDYEEPTAISSVSSKKDTNVVENFLTQALVDCFQNCNELPLKLRSDLEHCFDPHSPRMSAVVSARTFNLPVHFYHFLWKNIEAEEPFTRIVEQAFTNQSIAFHRPKAKPFDPSECLPWVDGDAWTARSPTIKFGSLQPIQIPTQLREIIEADIDKANELKKNEKYAEGGTINYPSVESVIDLLGETVGTTKVMIWHDQQFKSVSFSGRRLLVFGKKKGCIIQWETYTNFCGGPYSSYSCGMG